MFLIFVLYRQLPILLHKDEIDGANDEQEGQNMVPMQVVALKHNVRDDGENGQRNTFLNDFQLHERERTAVVDEAEAVGGHLAAIFEKGDGHEKPMTAISGQLLLTPDCCKRRWPYHARVIKMLLRMSRMMV